MSSIQSQWLETIACFKQSIYMQRVGVHYLDSVDDIVENLSDWGTREELSPSTWTPLDLKAFCLDFLPMEVFEEDIFFEAVEPVLYQYLFFLLREGSIQDSAVWLSTLYSSSKAMQEKARQPHYWSNEKLFLMGALNHSYFQMNSIQRLEEFSTYYLNKMAV